MIIDGRAIASEVLHDVCKRVRQYETPPVVRAITLRPSPATESYLKIKVARANEGCMRMDVVRLPDEATPADVIAAIQRPGADAVIVQLPLPVDYDTPAIVNHIPLEQDVDVLSDAAYARFEKNAPGALVPPVAAAVLEVIAHTGFDVRGKRTVVIGRGRLVGKSTALALERLGASVSVVSRDTPDKEALYKTADLIVSGAGSAHLLTPELIKEGVALIDAGTSGSKGGVAGDIHPDCAQKALFLTPVPGGIGPIAVSCLFRNTVLLLELRKTENGPKIGNDAPR